MEGGRLMSSELDQYNIILFDMDGVITSENNYWRCAALTILETLYPDADKKMLEENAEQIKNDVFLNGEIIKAVKMTGINTNRDLTYCYLLLHDILKATLPGHDITKEILHYFKTTQRKADGIYEELAQRAETILGRSYDYYRREGDFWTAVQQKFQHWYMGDHIYRVYYNQEPPSLGKTGLIRNETPLFPIEDIRLCLKTLKSRGKQLGIGTGRTLLEIEYPLCLWKLNHYFDYDRFITYTDIQAAQNALAQHGIQKSLAKPHPYMFIKGMLGKDYDDCAIVRGDYDASLAQQVLVVGDAGSDILAAKAFGAGFAAVLTGPTGQEGRAYFEESGADFIFNNVLELTQL